MTRSHARPSTKDAGGEQPRYLARGVRIVHEDADVLVVDKPTGLVTADPTRGPGDAGFDERPLHTLTLFDQVKRYIREQRSAAPRPRRRQSREHGEGIASCRTPAARAWVIHRLDKEASGLVVFALSEAAFQWLKEDFKSKRVHRLYHALAEGIVGPVGHSGTKQSFMREEREPPGRSRTSNPATPRHAHDDPRRGKLAVTHYRIVATGHGRTLLHVRLETGRKNQIRVHFAEMGFPLTGDRRFGAKTDPIGRLGLHAAELGFTHAGTGKPMRFHSPPPASFARAAGLAKVRSDSGSVAEVGDSELSNVALTDAPATVGLVRPAPPPTLDRRDDTSWEQVADWYDQLQDDAGNDHYRMVILPGALRLIEPQAGDRILDVACGQGVLARRLGELGLSVDGVEASASLVQAAQRRGRLESVRFFVGDARELESLKLPPGYNAAACIMALANIDPLSPVFRGAASLLRPGGRFVAVIAHPAFRAPRQTSWGWDREGEQWRQYRRVDGYLSSGQVEIDMKPGRTAARPSTDRRAKAGRRRTGPAVSAPHAPLADDPVTTLTFHRPLQAYVRGLADAGLLIDRLEEWPSLRMASSGPRAPEENRARREIPMFLGLRAVKPC